MSYIEILSANNLTVKQWDAMIFKEYLGQVWWKNLMGTSTNAVIQVKDDLTKKKGDQITIGLRGQLQGGHVTGNTKGIGNEGKVDFFSFEIRIDNVRDLVKFEDVPMSSQRVAFNLLQEGKEALIEQARLRFEDDVTTALCTTALGRVRGRYIYGRTDANWDATHATALAALDPVQDVLSTRIIDIAKRKATIPVNATARVRPMKVRAGKSFEEWYTFVSHTFPLRDLVENDAAWRNLKLNMTPRSTESVLFTGSSFKGAWNGTLVYEYDRLPLIASTVQVSHALLLGAQAGAVAWGQRSKFGEEEKDVKHDVIYEVHEIRGIKKMVFDRATPEDHGLVNVFVPAVAD